MPKHSITHADFFKKDWDGSEAKKQARLYSIINPWYTIYNRPLRPYEQYWTFAGKTSDNNRSEAGQIIEYLKIKPKQFFGVDINEKIIDYNKQIRPDCNWLHRPLLHNISEYNQMGNFYPAIINIDHHKMYKGAIYDLLDIISILNAIKKKEILLVFNFMKDWLWGNQTSVQTISEVLSGSTAYQKFCRHWKHFQDGAYLYDGTGKHGWKFLTYIWYKQ